MKLSPIAICVCLFPLTQAKHNEEGINDDSSSIICPEGGGSCYSRDFSPSSEWQTVKWGQVIPQGLHVRLNLETGEQEAKFISDDEDDDIANAAVIVPQEDQPESPKSTQNTRRKPHKKGNINEGELSSFSSAVEAVLDFGEDQNVPLLSKALDTLIDLSHDIEYGAELTKDAAVFQALKQAAASVKTESPEVVEKIFRIMGSSLRNNEQAIENLLLQQPSSFIDGLYELLSDSTLSDKIHKRILGVVQALSSYPSYARANYNLESESTSSSVTKLVNLFPRLGRETQERLVQILEDVQIPGFNEETFGDAEEASSKMSRYLQSYLVKESSSTEEQFNNAVKSLVQLHKTAQLPSSHEFLEWLSKEVEERRSGLKKKSVLYSGTDSEIDSVLKSARHAVFGNPNADRKFSDEL